MAIVSTVGTASVAALHGYFLVLEMFLWTKPRGLKTFKLTPEFAEKTKVLAANQGLYNGFLAAGLAYGLVHPNPEVGAAFQKFFLSCVVVAGVYGGLSSSWSILRIQAIPAAVVFAFALTGF